MSGQGLLFGGARPTAGAPASAGGPRVMPARRRQRELALAGVQEAPSPGAVQEAPEEGAGELRAGVRWLPGGVTVARRTAYDGRWQALRWVDGVAVMVCEGGTEEEVLRRLDAARGAAGRGE